MAVHGGPSCTLGRHALCVALWIDASGVSMTPTAELIDCEIPEVLEFYKAAAGRSDPRWPDRLSVLPSGRSVV
jgi:hypothetical protein